ncbi:MAG TPA: DCC1-like thiol-disulfide oxidoreductase family protein [Polyangia bacterium]|nr:DCC1-like thiol-disulfide oxidoreductase family protein [Polyangia bacterium]
MKRALDFAALRRKFAESYLTMDARSAALGRVVVSIVLLIDLFRRVSVLRLFYTNEGLLPNHTLLWRPPTQWMFSFFFMASRTEEAALGFVICGLVYLALLVGWRTRLMRFAALVCVLSLHGRTTLVENGGDWTLGELMLWSSFLPLGRRFSVDSLRASLRRRRETTAAQLAGPFPGPVDPPAGGDPNRIVSLAAFTILLQLANAYFFNAIHKGGPTWLHGSAVHYVLYQNRMVTWFGVWMRPHMTPALSRVMSYAALATEASLPWLILSPWKRIWTRRIAVLAIIGLHTSFQLFINLGIFSWAMIGYTPFLLTSAEWELFGRLARRSQRRVTAIFDADCGVCFQLARVVARMDLFQRIRWVSSAELPADLPAGLDLSPALLQRTVVAVDQATGRAATRADGVALVLRALPLGVLWSAPLRIPGVRQVANLVYDAFSRRRRTISVWLGLAACAIPARRPAVAAPAAGGDGADAPNGGEAGEPVYVPEISAESRTPVRAWLGRVAWILREGTVLAMLIVLVNETLFINQAVPKPLRFDEPGWVKRLVAYPRLIQAWSMFASDAPMSDMTIVVDATTADGRHVDPYSETSSRYPRPGLAGIPPRLDNNSFFFNYSQRLPEQGAYNQAFIEWMLRYPERTGRAEDRILRFDAYVVEQDSPPPGETTPRNIRTRKFLSYP